MKRDSLNTLGIRPRRAYMMFRYGLLLVLSLPFLVPLLWVIATSLKSQEQIYTEPLQFVPNPVTLANYIEPWSLLDFPRFILNSFFITLLSTGGILLSSSVVGFAFALLPARGKSLIFGLLLATIMVPASVKLIPQFILFSKLGWLNSYLPLIVPNFFANAFYIFLFRQFFLTLPIALFESAELEGCHPLGVFRWIALPLSKPVFTTVSVFAFIGVWNEFLEPLVYLSDNSKFTLSLGLALFHGLNYTQLHYLMPMSLVALTPVVLIFFVAQHQIVQGIAVRQ